VGFSTTPATRGLREMHKPHGTRGRLCHRYIISTQKRALEYDGTRPRGSVFVIPYLVYLLVTVLHQIESNSSSTYPPQIDLDPSQSFIPPLLRPCPNYDTLFGRPSVIPQRSSAPTLTCRAACTFSPETPFNYLGNGTEVLVGIAWAT
jgi:hypothetical protein